MVEFAKYAQIKDRYCVYYLGACQEYLYQLALIRPAIERTIPKLELWLVGNSSNLTELAAYDRVMDYEDFEKEIDKFAFVEELSYDGKQHPIHKFLGEVDVNCVVNTTRPILQGGRVVILQEGVYPTKSLSDTVVSQYAQIFDKKGFDVDIEGEIEGAGFVIGVECLKLYKAAKNGIPTKLIPTGIGEKLFYEMFPNQRWGKDGFQLEKSCF